MEHIKRLKGLISEIINGQYWKFFFWSSVFVGCTTLYNMYYYIALWAVFFALNRVGAIKINNRFLDAIIGAISSATTFVCGFLAVIGTHRQSDGSGWANSEMQKMSSPESPIVYTDNGAEINEYYEDKNN